MNSEFTVVLVGDHSREIFDELKKVKLVMFHFETATVSSFKVVLSRTRPQLVIFEAGHEAESLRQMVSWILQQFPTLPWAVTGREPDIDSLLAYFRMGATDFIKQPVVAEDLKRMIQKVLNSETASKSDHKHETSQAFAFFSTKGGVGLTTLATNLAVELAAKNSGKVLLVDLVLQHGNVSDFLDLPPKFTLLDMIENIERLDPNLIENSLVKHPSGLYVLPCPKQPEDEDFISAAQMSEVLAILKRMFPYIVIDLGHEFTKTSISCLDFADHVFLVATPDVPSLCNGRNAFEILNRMGHGSEKVKMILNRWRMKGEISSDEIKKNLSVELFSQIPDDAMNCLIAVNQGKSVSSVAPKSEFTKGIRALVARLDNLKAKEVPLHVPARAA